ncbi:MAG: hypothetical protein L0154_21515 [Chloroflexi bacterium]|nr:hypothetical protein [Chloroflexota bacterium]
MEIHQYQGWVEKFITALKTNKDNDVLSALNGLKSRLESDHLAASQGKLKAPKGVKNFNKLAAIQAANVFFTKWIGVVQEHINYAANTGDWITDFRQKYINDPVAAGMTPKEQVMANVAKIDNVSSEHLQGIDKMWDLGGLPMRQRMTDLMGGVSDLRRMSGIEYFLEQVSPIHVGYEAAKAMFEFWITAVLYHGWTNPWETWMVTKANNQDFEGKPITVIDSYDATTRAQYELTPNGKKILKADGQPLVGDNIYVLTSDNTWYGGSKVGPIHHSSFMQGAPVKCAGHLHTDGGGNLQRIDLSSGHYTPDKTALKRAMSVLSKQMDISDVQTGNY